MKKSMHLLTSYSVRRSPRKLVSGSISKNLPTNRIWNEATGETGDLE